MSPLWRDIFREFPEDLNNALSYAETLGDLEERSALLERLAARWPTNFDVLEAVATCFAHEVRDAKRALAVLRQLRASVIAIRDNHDPKLSHDGSAEFWKIFVMNLQGERTVRMERFNSLVSTLADEGLECRSLMIPNAEPE